jgi:hypothetical protein
VGQASLEHTTPCTVATQLNALSDSLNTVPAALKTQKHMFSSILLNRSTFFADVYFWRLKIYCLKPLALPFGQQRAAIAPVTPSHRWMSTDRSPAELKMEECVPASTHACTTFRRLLVSPHS